MSQKRSALGRGLGALISSPPQTAEAPAAPNPANAPSRPTRSSVDTKMRQDASSSDARGAQQLDIGLVDPNPEQPRREFDPAALQQLAESIGQHGVLQPVVVRRAGERFEGHHGRAAVPCESAAGRTRIPAVILDVDLDDRLELAIVETCSGRI